MSRLLQLRAAVIAAVKTALPGFSVEGHLGRFTPADLNRFLLAAPAVRVAILGLTDTMRTGEDGELLDGVAKLALYVVTRDQGVRLGREEIAVAAVERLCLMATGARWGLNFAHPADAPTAQTLFNDETLAKGVALWAIEINQPARLGLPDDLTDPENPLRELFVGVAPEIGAPHRDDYIGPIDLSDGEAADV